MTAYTYDGEEHRVKKLVGENTRFIYGIGGQLIAEFDGATGNLKKEYVYGGATLITIEPTAVNSNGTQYTTTDSLGSPRVITNASASVVSRHDYMPFGEELGAGVGGRTTAMGFSNSGDNNRKKFTLYERDTETALDFAQARYYSATQGRFTSPDPLMSSAEPSDPQSWNRYAYVGNNPLKLIDPSGMSSQPGGRNISNWNGAMASEQATAGISPWPDDTAGDVFIRATITTTQVIVQEVGGGQVTQEATITITETLVEYVNGQGVVLQSEPVETSAKAENTGNAPITYTQPQLDVMENVAKNIVEVSRAKGFDPAVALGIAQTETNMGTRQNTEGVAWKKSEINPMQLSGGAAKGRDLRGNIAGAIDLFNSKPGNTLNAKLQAYTDPKVKVAYANKAQGLINTIRRSIYQRIVVNNFSQQPPRVGPFPIWRP